MGGDFTAIPLAAPSKPRPPSDLVIRATVKLGDDVEVRRDTTIDIVAKGAPILMVKDRPMSAGRSASFAASSSSRASSSSSTTAPWASSETTPPTP